MLHTLPLPFVPYDELNGRPNIIVDGAAADGSVLTLSHWPGSETPAEFAADTSAEIAFNYLEAANRHVQAEAVSNNHFDVDGLISCAVLSMPETMQSRREFWIDVATAGDFERFTNRDAARVAFAITTMSTPETSPLEKSIFELPYPELCGALYKNLLPQVVSIADELQAHRQLWEVEDSRLSESERCLDTDEVKIEDHPQAGLAIITAPGEAELHPMSLHNRTDMPRILTCAGNDVTFRYRYESWVMFASRPIAKRVDLAPLAKRLNELEPDESVWIADPISGITPKLNPAPGKPTSIPFDKICEIVQEHLVTAPEAWDPWSVSR